MADPNAAGPYDYPTPAMLQQYSADARRYGGAPGYATGTPLDTSRLGAPQATPTKHAQPLRAVATRSSQAEDCSRRAGTHRTCVVFPPSRGRGLRSFAESW